MGVTQVNCAARQFHGVLVLFYSYLVVVKKKKKKANIHI